MIDHIGVEKLAEALDMNVDEIKSIVKHRKLRTEDIKKIHSMYEAGKSMKKIAEAIGFNTETVRQQLLKRKDYTKQKRRKALSEDVINIIIRLSEKGYSATEIAVQTGLNVCTIRNYTKSKYKHLTG